MLIAPTAGNRNLKEKRQQVPGLSASLGVGTHRKKDKKDH
jgi:hypothetical protein